MEIVAVGNALLDVIAYVEGDLVPSLGFHANSVSHISPERMALLLSRLTSPWMGAGGGAANMARAASLLGAQVRLVGCIGDDEAGRNYRADLESSGVRLALLPSLLPTGVFCALIDPGGGRTLVVSRGAAPEVSKQGLELDSPPGSILFIDGFLLADTGFFQREAEGARGRGMRVAVDLGSRALVHENRDFLLEALPRLCDLVFANEDEFIALAGLPLYRGLELLGGGDCGFVVKRAERGALYAQGGRVCESPVRAQEPFDETGAGDAFAAGFLCGLLRGLPPERCVRLGNRIAEEAIAVPGLRVEAGRIEAAGLSVEP